MRTIGRPADTSAKASITRCPGCAAVDGHVFWRAERLPVLCHVQCATHDEALAAPCAPVELTLCRSCGLVYNQLFDAGLISYSTSYENALHFSPHFRAYANELADHFVECHGLRGRRVLEIGCGDGQFLAAVCARGGNQGLGLDPAFDPNRSALVAESNVRIIPAPFDRRFIKAFPPELVCCRHVLEHLDAPMSLLHTVRHALAGQSDALVYFEVPNLLHILEQMSVWDVIYEHCLYFTPMSLCRLFRAAGFKVIDFGESYGAQFAWVEARADDPALEESQASAEHAATLEPLAARFGQCIAARMDSVRDRVLARVADGQRVVAWGAGSKAVTLLNLLQFDDQAVRAVVDQNPRKHGHYLVGTGHRIMSPIELHDLQPDVVIVMNPLYQEEITQQLDEMGMRPDLLTA